MTQTNGPLGVITAWPTYLGAAFLITVLWAREPEGPEARPLYAIALGFLFLRTAGGVFSLLSLVGMLPFPTRIVRALFDATLYFGAFAIFAFIAARGAPRARREARVGLAAVGAFALIFGILRVATPQLSGQSVSGTFSGLSFILFPALVVYGLLQGRLPGLETRARLTVRASTIAAVFVGIFLVVAEVAGSFFQNAYGWAFGGLAAGIAIIAIHPIQRVAERVASAAVPVDRTAAAPLVHEERLSMYREQARVAWSDGNLSADERRMLDAAREHLGLTHEEAAAIEREAIPGQ